jgi:hypothetical protein
MPPAAAQTEDGIMSVPHLMTFGPAWVKPTTINRASVWRVLALAKVEALKRF